jgi:hypothetical protein
MSERSTTSIPLFNVFSLDLQSNDNVPIRQSTLSTVLSSTAPIHNVQPQHLSTTPLPSTPASSLDERQTKKRIRINEDDKLTLMRLCVEHQSDYVKGKIGAFWRMISELLYNETGTFPVGSRYCHVEKSYCHKKKRYCHVVFLIFNIEANAT